MAVSLALAVGCSVVPSGPGVDPALWSRGDAAADPALVALSIMPPGNGNASGFTAAFGDDQRRAYDSIDDAVAAGTLTDTNLSEYFKDARLGVESVVRVDEPRPGVVVGWDSHGIPRVRGRSDQDVAFGAGWVTAESRLLVAEVARVLGRAGVIEMGGGDLLGALGRLGETRQVNYTDAELEGSLDEAVVAAGREGPAILSAIDAYVAGINEWVDAHASPPELRDLGVRWTRWRRADVIAVAGLVDEIFGGGGGAEVRNADAVRALTAQLGPAGGAATFSDLRMADEAGATSHVEQTFPFPLFADPGGSRVSADNQVDPRSVAVPDARADRSSPAETPLASNFLLVGGRRSRSGHPIMVGGPQTSFLAPGLLFEMELRGGSYDSRGVTVPGLGPWVVIGRSRSSAWTATSGSSDLTDERVERLCEPDGSAPTARSTHYRYQGRCVPMTRPDRRPLTAWRTVHGPVVGTAAVNGAPVAISRQRMSRLQVAQSARAFWALNRDQVRTASAFVRTMSVVPMSFNWGYVNHRDIAYFHSGYYPIRARGVASDLPSWGTGEWEWQGRLDWRRQPQAINPPDGLIMSWNNKVAPGWRAADGDWGHGSAQRVDLIRRRVGELHDATPAGVVAVLQDAATADLRGELLVPAVLRVLDTAPAPSPALARLRNELERWSAAGAHRRDTNQDRFYDDPMVAVMDAWYPRLMDAIFRAALGDFYRNPELRRPARLDTPPSLSGSAFGGGWYSAVQRDLERVAGVQATPSGTPVFCGAGSLVECRRDLWRTLAAMVPGAGTVRAWTEPERIRFLPLVVNPESIRWVNRSTFQQVMSFR